MEIKKMNREELNKLTKEELIEEYLDLQDDNAWWQRRCAAERRTAWEIFKPKIDKAIEYIKDTPIGTILEVHCGEEEEYTEPLLEILGDKENE
jgi:hypothetical protein